VWCRHERIERSLATLLLADLSLSTDAYATQTARVIDLIREALFVFGEALAASGDPFEMLGFSSVRRQHVRLQHLKGFDEPWGGIARDRVGAIKPGYYTRMGAAIRHATQRLAARPERQRLLLILTDGKPNDLDVYEGRYGLEDTRHAVQAARAAGLTPFAVTIDEQAHDYLPMLFGRQGYAMVHRPQDLVQRLAGLYATLTRAD
jgi:nitric oxide reductase NorD protein